MSKKQTAIVVKGSLSAISKQEGKSLAESFLGVDTIIILDTSGSMSCLDAPGNLSRYQAACNELKSLQEKLPGKIAIISFSSYAIFCPNGEPTFLGGGTNMVEALKFVKPADDCDIRFILISDGHPDEKQRTLDTAATFKSKIDCIYIGPEETGLASGRDFLNELAAKTGGVSLKSKEIGMLAAPVLQLLEAGR